MIISGTIFYGFCGSADLWIRMSIHVQWLNMELKYTVQGFVKKYINKYVPEHLILVKPRNFGPTKIMISQYFFTHFWTCLVQILVNDTISLISKHCWCFCTLSIIYCQSVLVNGTVVTSTEPFLNGILKLPATLCFTEWESALICATRWKLQTSLIPHRIKQVSQKIWPA